MGSKAPGGQQASLVTFVTNFIVLGVIGADERADIVDDDAYTNALVAETLKYEGWAPGFPRVQLPERPRWGGASQPRAV